MPCAFCGKAETTDDGGFCIDCAAKVKLVSDTSSFLHAATSIVAAETETGSGESRVGDPGHRTAKGPTSSVLLEFGQCEACKLRNPFSVSIDARGNITVMDQPAKGKYRLLLFAQDGEFIRVILECEQGEGPMNLKYPKGVATDSHGNIFIPDAGNNRIQRFDAGGAPLGAIGSQGEGPGEFEFPCDVDTDEAGMLYVADTYNSRVQKLTPQGVMLLCIGNPAIPQVDNEPELDEPMAVTVDEHGAIFVADTKHHRVSKYDTNGKLAVTFGAEGAERGQFKYPSDVRVTDGGMVFVADRNNSRVQKFDSLGRVLTEFSLENVAGDVAPGGDIAIDSNGCLLICNVAKHTVARVEFFDSQHATQEGSL